MNRFRKPMKEGEYMTRIVAVANNKQLAVSSDSMYTNTLTGEKTIKNRKLFHGNNMIIGILGISEIFLVHGVLNIGEKLQEILCYSKNEGLLLLNEINECMSSLYSRYMITDPCLLCFFWLENNRFHMYCEEFRYNISLLGSQQTQIYSPFGEIRQDNLDLFDFRGICMEAGDGLDNNPELTRTSYEASVLDVSYMLTKKAVEDESISTVGGPIYSILLDNSGFQELEEEI